jgi:mannose-6-phosphate isomerase
MHPIIFEPILKDRIWGGEKLKTLLHKNNPTNTIGESWEISGIKNEESIVTDGEYQGKTLNQLINEFPEEILGTSVFKKFGKEFPLLFKFLDAKQDLSIQLHPNDALAQKRHNSFGKTEMWYVVQADPKSKIIVGFNKNCSPEEYLTHLKNETLPSILKEISVKEGDAFFINTGTIHAIGKGIVIAEIQQTSDITYRIYDWNRKDSKGNTRELHIDLALEAINYTSINPECNYSKNSNQSNLIANCPYFETNFIPLQGTYNSSNNKNSFTVLMCINGNFEIEYNSQRKSYKKGDTILIPAILNNYKLIGNASLLEIYIR